jgi:serine-type D-Ala-D-Ala carboxypeptidase/endopeptidase (penicillin-binding protein 4)
MQRRPLLLLLAFFGLSTVALSTVAFAAVNWNALLDQDGASAVRFGVALGGEQPFGRNIDEAFAPASTSKIFTAGAILSLLGKDYRYPTVLRWREEEPGVAKSLTLTGSGDPSWGMPQFGENLRTRVDSIAAALKAAGVRTVQGEPKVDSADPRWRTLRIPAGWKIDDTLGCGGALAFGFNLKMNCATYRVRSATQGAWIEEGLVFPVKLAVSSGGSTSLSVRLETEPARFVISGTLKKGETPSFTLPIFEPESWVRNLFRRALLDQGIRVVVATASEETPTMDELVAARRWDPRSRKELVFHSPPLSELLKPFLKNSVNFLGDAFLKSLAQGQDWASSDDLLTPGLGALRDYLWQLGLPRDFTLHDGSGLSRTSRTSPRMLLEFLERVRREPYFPTLLQALAVAGVDGTLRNRMKSTAAAGRLRGKTGTLNGVYNLAGYVPSGGDHVPFVLFSRTTSDKSSITRRAEDRVGARLAAIHASLMVDAADMLELDEPYPYYPEQAGMDDQ